ncbi:general odorant-binding protein 19d [Drosophila mojavensis]|uniref:Odorant-binding protein 19b n=1 Tax=Drosophila mojavensis TaxID=7230 RepID=B4L658_DROMO|nr:general odorant-binding protein 19d [Drosophila mojavensis]EDW05854.2 Odorant-binding protein 19b [Drosophila mojavensis]
MGLVMFVEREKLTMMMMLQRTCLTMLLLTLLTLAQADDQKEEDTAMSLSEVVEMVEPFGNGCEPKPERSHIEEMVLNKEDASHESKCFRRCMLKQFEIMGEGQMQFDEAKTVDMMNMMFPDKEANSKAIAAKCNQAPNGITDECEVCHAISMCMLREMRAASYKIPEVKE